MENFKQPIFNFCRRIGKKFLSNIGVSSKQILFLKNFPLKFYYFLFSLSYFLYFYYIKKLFKKQISVFNVKKFFSFNFHIENLIDSIFEICRKRMLNFCNNYVTIILQLCYKIVTKVISLLSYHCRRSQTH